MNYNTIEIKIKRDEEKYIITIYFYFSIVYLNEYTGLVVAVGGEGLGLLRGNGRVPLDQGGHHSTYEKSILLLSFLFRIFLKKMFMIPQMQNKN